MPVEALAMAGAKKFGGELIRPLLKKALPGLIDRAAGVIKEFTALEVSQFINRAEIASCLERIRSSPVTVGEFERFLRGDGWERICTAAAASAALGDGIEAEELTKQISREIKRTFPELGGQQAEDTAADLSTSVRQISELCWQTVLNTGALSPVEATSQSARRLFSDEIEAARKHFAITQKYPPDQIRSFEQFSGKYLRTLGRHHRKITPPSTTDSIAVDIEKIYVPCDFIRSTPKVESDARANGTIPYQQLLATTYRIVVLGTPGAGKSTFLRKICFDLWSHPQNCPIGSAGMIPVFVVLREYGRKKKEEGISILEYALQATKSDLQLDGVPDGYFEYLASSGKALFLFDGLDELIEIADRISVKDAVERFADNNPGTSIIVTARQVGYEQASLSTETFRAYKLTSFSADQVQCYCEKWFGIHGDRNAEEQEKTVKSFMRESKSVSDVRSNPLLLALMCNLYKQDGYLPRNRPSIYSRCADLLFEKWDRHRGIKVAISAEYLLRPAIMNLAFWIYSDSKLREGVTEAGLVHRTAEILSKNFDTSEEAEHVARGFVEFCRGRAWVFTDIGSNQTEPLYQFTHGTFLEFFTAQYLVSNSKDLHNLIDTAITQIKVREWDIVCQLAIQMKATGQQDGTDECMELLLRAIGDEEHNARANVLSFIARSLEFLYPTPNVRRLIVSECLKFVFSAAKVDLKRQKPEPRPERSSAQREVEAEILPALMSAADENLRTIFEEVGKTFHETLQTGGPLATGAAFIATSLNHPHIGRHGDIGLDTQSRLAALLQALRSEALKNALKTDIHLAALGAGESMIPLPDLISTFGITALTVWAKFPFAEVWRGPLDQMIFQWALSCRGKNPTLFGISISQLHQILLDAPTPWARPNPPKPFRTLWIEKPPEFMFPKDKTCASVVALIAILSLPNLSNAAKGSPNYQTLNELLLTRDRQDGREAQRICEDMQLPEIVRLKVRDIVNHIPVPHNSSGG